MNAPATLLVFVLSLLCLACGDDDSAAGGAGGPGGTLAALDQSKLEVARERCRCDLTFGGEGTATTAEDCAQSEVYWTDEPPEQDACRDQAAMADPNFASLVGCQAALNREIAACYRTNTACAEASWEQCWVGKDDDDCFEMYPLSDATQQMIRACSGEDGEEDF